MAKNCALWRDIEDNKINLKKYMSSSPNIWLKWTCFLFILVSSDKLQKEYVRDLTFPNLKSI